MFGLLVSRTTAGAAARHSLRASADVAARSSLTVGPLVDPIAVLCDDSTWSYCSEDYGHVKAIGKDSLNIDVSDDSLVKYRNRSGEEAPAPVYTDAAGEPQSIRWLQPCLVLRCAAIHVIVIIGNKIARSARIYDGAGKRMVARSDATAIHGTLQSSGQTPVGAIAGPLDRRSAVCHDNAVPNVEVLLSAPHLGRVA